MVNHGFGLFFILPGEGNVGWAIVMSARLSEPFFHRAAPDLVCVVLWWWVCGCGWCHRGLPEPGGLTTMSDASVPWYTTPTLPQSDKLLSVAVFAPSSFVKFVSVKLCFGAIHCMLACRTMQ